MALSLDPTLKAAQDGNLHHPIVEIISSSFGEAIPIDLHELTADVGDSAPNAMMHSTGRYLGIYTRSTISFKYVYTDVDRLTYSFVTISLPASYVAVEASLCELSPSGNIGLVLYCTYGGQEKILSMVISPTGTTVTAQAEILSYATASHILACPCVRRLSSGTYFLAYIDKTVGGATYAIRKRTSADFASWSAEGTCSIGGLTETKKIGTFSFTQISTNQIWLWFDYVDSVSGSNELVNIYYSTSSDNGVTWSSATKFTNYATYDTVGKHPVCAQKIANQMHLFFNEQSSLAVMDNTAAGFCYSDEPKPGFIVYGLTMDSSRRKMYALMTRNNSNPPGGNPGRFSSIVRIDLDTFTIDACWSTDSVPAFGTAWVYPGPFGCSTWCNRNHGEQYLIPIASNNYANKGHIAVLNGENDTITEYHFNAETGISQNVTWTPPAWTWYLTDTWVDFNSKLLYVCFVADTGSNGHFMFGSLDLTEVKAPGENYTFTQIFTNTWAGYEGRQEVTSVRSSFENGATFDVINDLLIYATGVSPSYSGSSGFKGHLRLYTLATPALLKNYSVDVVSEFPWNGTGIGVLKDGKIHAGFVYKNDEPGEDWKKGLCVIDPETDEVTYKQPSWATLNSYKLRYQQVLSNGKIIMNSYGYGITTYDPATEEWVLYDNNSVPGLDPYLLYRHWCIGYDPIDGNLFTDSFNPSAASVLDMFPLEGILRTAYYHVGTYSGGSWSWSAKASFITGYTESDVAVALANSSKEIYVFWVSGPLGGRFISWGKEGLTLDLSNDYLLKGVEHSISWSATSPNTLEFSVSHGHLFDSDNLNSLLSPILKKGRKITVRLGEKVGGTDYFHEQGTFKIVSTKIQYGVDEYPIARVVAQDKRCTWDHKYILATEYYDTDPKSILQDIAYQNLGIPLSDQAWPTFDTAVGLKSQWMETWAKDIIDLICNRFGYVPIITVDDKLTAKKISNLNPTDHVYADATKILNYTPDDDYSDFTNQIIVIGDDPTQYEVLFEEERVGQISGTIGWWRREKDYTVYYSTDSTRRCRYPRLVVVESATSAPFSLGGKVSQEISYVDPAEKYCTITVDGPDLIPVVASSIAMIIAGYFIGDAVISLIGGWTRPVGTLIQMIAINLAIAALASICNFQYEIWARPVGYVKKTVQSTPWNDAELQEEIQEVVLRKENNPLCSSIQACNQVANQLGLVAQMQRRRRNFTKDAHLQDEFCDTIQVVHPHTSQAVKVFVAGLKRRFLIPADESDKNGYVLDNIEGWKI